MPIGSPQWMYKSGEAYTVDQGLKFEDGRTAYLSWTPESSGSATWTISMWVKRSRLSTGSDTGGTFISAKNSEFSIFFHSDDVLRIWDNGGNAQVYTSQVFRDTSAWYHIVLKRTTSSPYLTLYVNGSEVTNYTTDQRSTYGGTTNFLTTQEHIIGGWNNGGYKTFDGYIAEVNVIDGQALTPADFGETGDYGEWKPKEYSGTYGTNGFYLPFKADYSVEGFNTVLWTATNAPHYIGGVGFKPDLVLGKKRTDTGRPTFIDSVRGATKQVHTDISDAENTNANGVGSFTTDGFYMPSGSGSGAGEWNGNSGDTHVAWNWDMGADTPTGFGAVAYKGGGARHQVDGFGFAPSLVWIKDRDGAESHSINDIVRGTQKRLSSSGTDAENAGGITKFNPDGFTTSTGYGSDGDGSGHDFVAWGWNMGGTTVTNTSGSENSTVRANPTYGQSIVSYVGKEVAGTTYGHGLSSAPELIIVKNRSRTSNWKVYYGDNTDALTLNTDDTTDDQTYYWNDTSPTSSVFTVGAGTETNGNDENLVAYCFHSVSGYSKFGSYSGTGSSHSVTLGFRPAFVMVKRTNEAHNWYMFDATRNPLGQFSDNLLADSSNAEGSDNVLGTITDTGFTLVNDNGFCNESGDTYIYMAFAGGMDSISDYNDTGDIDSRVKANPTYGQSIVSYSGASNATSDSDNNSGNYWDIGHGLSSKPEMIIVKQRSGSGAWYTTHKDLGTNAFANHKHLQLQSTGVTATGSAILWGGTEPTSSVFTVGGWDTVNRNGEDYIAYCFHSVTGYSKFGTYEGTGSTHTVTLGFRPAFLLIKNIDAAGNWCVFDNARNPYDSATVGKQMLRLNSENAEQTKTDREPTFLDTGFSIGDSDEDTNASGDTFIYMAFADKREYAYWLDQSGNNNDWTSNNLTESDISVDSPTNNFATLNPLDKDGDVTVSEGNLKALHSGTQHDAIRSSFGKSTGKWYYEALVPTAESYIHLGLANTEWSVYGNVYDSSLNWTFQSNGSTNNGSNTNTGISALSAGDIVQVAYDLDASKIWFGVNNTWVLSGNPSTAANPVYSNLSGTLAPVGSFYQAENGATFNFGQDSSFAGAKTAQGNQDGNDIGDFYYTPPTGFLALCTSNLPAVAVTPSEHFNTVLWSGDGGSQTISGVGFQTDLTWVKSRNSTNGHHLFDSVRAFGSAKSLSSNSTQAEGAHDASYGYISSPTSDGFTASAGSSGSQYSNDASYTYVAWNWKAGTAFSNDASATSIGNVDSSGQVNTDAGFSIVSWQYTTSADNLIAHGLSVAPEMMIIKSRTTAYNWDVYHKDLSAASKRLLLNTAGAEVNGFTDTAPTSTVFEYNTSGATNNDNMIAYCFHSVDGYSKVGSYTGNANADGTFIYTGFRPAYIMVKNTNASQHWKVHDSTRSSYNLVNKDLNPNESGAEGSSDSNSVDFCSNGFKLRAVNAAHNGDGNTMIYLAFAETPFKYSNAR